MEELKIKCVQYVDGKYTSILEKKYISIYSKIDTPQIKRAVALINEFRSESKRERIRIRGEISEKQIQYDKETALYYGSITLYGILWYIFRANPDTKFTSKVLSIWLKAPLKTVQYNLRKLLVEEFIEKMGKTPSYKYKMGPKT